MKIASGHRVEVLVRCVIGHDGDFAAERGQFAQDSALDAAVNERHARAAPRAFNVAFARRHVGTRSAVLAERTNRASSLSARSSAAAPTASAAQIVPCSRNVIVIARVSAPTIVGIF